MTAPSILVVDDDLFVRDSFVTLLSTSGFSIWGACASAEDALVDLVATRPTPDVVLMDIRMFEMSGITATHEIKLRFPEIHVVILTSLDYVGAAEAALHAGASGFLVKNVTINALTAAITAVLAGLRVLPPDLHQESVVTNETIRIANTLSTRDKDLIRGVCAGATNAAMAKQAFISESTVKNDILILQRRFNVPNRTRLALLAHDLGLDR